MDYMLKLEETMKVLDMLSIFLIKESENYIESDDIRTHIEEAFVQIRAIYDELEEDPLIKDIINSQDKIN